MDNPELTLSARLLNTLLENNQDSGTYGLDLAEQYKHSLASQSYHIVNEGTFVEQAGSSLTAQKAIEDADSVTFDVFLQDYFADLKGG